MRPLYAHLHPANPQAPPRPHAVVLYAMDVLAYCYSSSLSGTGPSVHAMVRSDGRHASHMRMPGTPLRVAMVLVLVLDRANFHPQAVRPSEATKWMAEEVKF